MNGGEVILCIFIGVIIIIVITAMLHDAHRDIQRPRKIIKQTMSDGSVRYVIKVRDTDGDWNINKHVKTYENIDGIERTVLAESIFDSLEEAKKVLFQQYGKHVVKEETVYRKE